MAWRRGCLGAVSAVTVALAVVGVALGACGGGAPSKAQFVAKADPICKEGSDVAALYTTPSDMSSIKDFGAKVAGTTDKTVAQLDKLKFPSGADGTAAHAMVKAMQDAAVIAKAVGSPVDKQDYPAIEVSATAMATSYKTADDKARAIGSAQCGKGERTAADKLSASAGPTLKAAFVNAADGLCSTARSQVLAIEQPKTTAQAKSYIDKTLPIGIKLRGDVAALPSPTFDRDKLGDFLDAWDDVINTSKEMRDAVNAEDNQQIVDLIDTLQQDAANLKSKATVYGFHQCGQA